MSQYSLALQKWHYCKALCVKYNYPLHAGYTFIFHTDKETILLIKYIIIPAVTQFQISKIFHNTY